MEDYFPIFCAEHRKKVVEASRTKTPVKPSPKKQGKIVQKLAKKAFSSQHKKEIKAKKQLAATKLKAKKSRKKICEEGQQTHDTRQEERYARI